MGINELQEVQRTDNSLSSITDRLREVKDMLARRIALMLGETEVRQLEEERDVLKNTYCKIGSKQ